MRRLNKDSAWIFEMAVKTSRSEVNKIRNIIEDSNGVILGLGSSDGIIKFLIVLDLVSLDDLINKMIIIYPGKIKFRKAKVISFK